ncbi:MAG TPA: hypothetical protein VGG03_20895 [Thermoanaerobaculia bacterium]|jgi:hypothetical protein
MKRLLTLWLTLLGAFWLTRAVVSALLFQRAVQGRAALLLLVAVPLAQALVIAWVTRDPGPPDDPSS